MTTRRDQARNVMRYFDREGLKYTERGSSEKPVISVSFGGGDFSYESETFNIFIDDDGSSASIVAGPIVGLRSNEKKQAVMTLLCNKYNSEYRWFRFYVDSDKDLMMQIDIMFTDDNAGAACEEAVRRGASILDDVYPEIMRTHWS